MIVLVIVPHILKLNNPQVILIPRTKSIEKKKVNIWEISTVIKIFQHVEYHLRVRGMTSDVIL